MKKTIKTDFMEACRKPDRRTSDMIRQDTMFYMLAFLILLVTVYGILVLREVQETNEIIRPRPTVTIAPTKAPAAAVFAAEMPEEETGLQLPDPKVADGSFKTYMDYRSITCKTSAQYKLQQKATTDAAGFRRYQNYYLVDMGTAYAKKVGETFEITLASGKTIACMIGDIKAPQHTDKTNRYMTANGNIVEWIIDRKRMSPRALSLGDVSSLGLQGAVVRILPTGEAGT